MLVSELKAVLDKCPDDALVMGMDDDNPVPLTVKGTTLEIHNREETTGGATLWIKVEES